MIGDENRENNERGPKIAENRWTAAAVSPRPRARAADGALSILSLILLRTAVVVRATASAAAVGGGRGVSADERVFVVARRPARHSIGPCAPTRARRQAKKSYPRPTAFHS